jgi:CDP-glucose 4,6-dehydratase
MIDKKFWQGRSVFVTGHTGFMGGWLSFALARAGARVTGYALQPPTDPSFFDAVALDGDVTSIEADIRDLNRLTTAMREAAPEFVFHLAAQPLVRTAHHEPVETFAVNVMGTVNVLEAMRGSTSLRAAILVTTDKVYANREWDWGYREEDRLGAHEPYGGSKAAAELAVESYRSYFPRAGIATVRAGNVIGGGDWAPERLVPDAIRAFARGRTLTLRRPDAVRPFQHVLDPICGMATLAERLADSPAAWTGPWNFGPDEREAATVEAVARQLAQLWGEARVERATQEKGPAEAKLLTLSSAKAKAKLAWKPTWSLARALSETVSWYKDFLSHADMRAATARQIAAFGGAN